MRIGISTSAFACERIQDPERDMDRFLTFCRQMCAESVQVDLVSVEGFGADSATFRQTLKRIRNLLQGLKIYLWTGFALDVSDWGSASSGPAEEQLHRAFALLETADSAAMAVVDVVGLPDPNGPEWSRFVENYAALVEHAGRCRVKLAAHCNGATFARLSREIPDPEVNGLCLCFAMCHEAGEVVADVAVAAGACVFHIHASDVSSSNGKWQSALLGRGEVDIPQAIAKLAHHRHVPVTVTHCPAVVGLTDDLVPVAWGMAYLRGLSSFSNSPP